MKTNYKDTLVSEYFNNMIAKIGENIVLNDLTVVDTDNLITFHFMFTIVILKILEK